MAASDPKQTFLVARTKPVMLTVMLCPAIRRIKKLQLETKPNPAKDGDGKPRVLVSSVKPEKTARTAQDRQAART